MKIRAPECRSLSPHTEAALTKPSTFPDIAKTGVSTEHKLLGSRNPALVILITHCNPYFAPLYYFALAALGKVLSSGRLGNVYSLHSIKENETVMRSCKLP